MKKQNQSKLTMSLIGPSLDIILGIKLSSIKQTLSSFLNHHWQNKDTILKLRNM